MREQAEALAVQGVYVGTSSWKYDGWNRAYLRALRAAEMAAWSNAKRTTRPLRWLGT